MTDAFNRASRSTLVPGHFVVLTHDRRIDAVLAKAGVRLADALERRGLLDVVRVSQGPNDGSGPLTPSPNIKSLDPHSMIIAMPADDADPVLNRAEGEAWHNWRDAYTVSLDVPPFGVVGELLLLPSQEPYLLKDQATYLFLPVFAPIVEIGDVTLTDIRPDAILVNRDCIRRTNKAVRR